MNIELDNYLIEQDDQRFNVKVKKLGKKKTGSSYEKIVVLGYGLRYESLPRFLSFYELSLIQETSTPEGFIAKYKELYQHFKSILSEIEL